jgi:hypothetical protein
MSENQAAKEKQSIIVDYELPDAEKSLARFDRAKTSGSMADAE